jgi:hypothetical protein
MKAISVRQPWANMIFEGNKTIETRNLFTNYKGPLMIHASKIQNKADFVKANIDYGLKNLYPQIALIGIVDLIKIERLTPILWEELRTQHLVPGKWPEFNNQYAWFFENPRQIKPIPYRGLPGLFSIDPGIESLITYIEN